MVVMCVRESAAGDTNEDDGGARGDGHGNEKDERNRIP